MSDLRRRRSGPLLSVLVDLVGQARVTRSWGLAGLLVLALAAVVVGALTQLVVPLLIYTGL